MKRRLKLMVMLLMMLSAGSGAKDLGTWGNVFEPAEQDMLAFIQNRLKGMEQTGELDRLRKEATERVKEHAVRPTPVEGLTKAKEYRSFAWDPTFTVKETITDMQGNVIARKGDTVNPLDKVPFSQVLFFIDGDDKEQVNWTRQQLAGQTSVQGGNDGRLRHAHQRRLAPVDEHQLARRVGDRRVIQIHDTLRFL